MARQKTRNRRPKRTPYRPSTSSTPSVGWMANVKKGAQWAWRNREQLGKAGKAAGGAFKKWYNSKPITKTRNRLKQTMQGTSQHNDTSTRYFRCVIRKGRRKGVIQRIMKKKHHFKFTEDWNTVVSSTEGRQNSAILKTFGSRQQVQGIISPVSMDRNNPIATSRSYYEMNPYRANGGSVIFPPGVASVPMSNDKIYYKCVLGTLKIINLTTLATEVKVYWLKCKRDAYWGPNEIWDHALTDESMGSAANIPAATTGVATATPGAPIRQNIGQNPFHLQTFKAHYKVLQKNVYYLQGGDEVDTNFRFEYNKILDKSVLEETPVNTVQPTEFLANYTVIPYVIFNGSLIGVGTPATEVTNGVAKLGFYVNQTHEFGPVPAELKTPTTNYFPGALEGANTERQIIDTDMSATVVVV